MRRAGRPWVIDRYVKRYCRPFTVEGAENLRAFRGGAIVIANHSSHFDTPVVLSALPERIRGKIAIAAAADKFYAHRRKRTWWYSLFLNTFPVHRGGGTKHLDYPDVAATARLVDPDLPGRRPVEGRRCRSSRPARRSWRCSRRRR